MNSFNLSQFRHRIRNIFNPCAQFPDSVLIDLCDSFTMPLQIVKALAALDEAADKLYDKSVFTNNANRVALIFKKYQETTDDPKN